MKKGFLLLILPILFLFFVTPVCADWSQVSIEGDWSVCERTHWEQNDVEVSEGTARWEISIQNFSGYKAIINFTELYTRRLEWWWESAAKYVDIYFKFRSNLTGNYITIWVGFKDYQYRWGLFGGRKVGVLCEWNGTLDGYYITDYNLNPSYVEVYLTFNGTKNILITAFLYEPSKTEPYLLMKYDYDILENEFWNITLTQTVKHRECGFFKGFLYDQIYGNWETPSLPESALLPYYEANPIWQFVDAVKYTFGTVLPGAVMNLINLAGSWASFFTDLIVLVGQSAIQFFPFFPLIFLFWLLDAIITSVYVGNLQPVGNAVMTIYNTLRGVVSAIVSIAETIWSIIKFW